MVEKPKLYKVVLVDGDPAMIEFPVVEETLRGTKIWVQSGNKGNGEVKYVSKTKQQYAWATKMKALENFKLQRQNEYDRLMREVTKVNQVIEDLDIMIRHERKAQEKRRVSQATS